MLAIAALCAAPVIASYLAFYVWQPAGRTNYGDLLEVRPLPDRTLSHLDGRPFRFADLKGKWVMLMLDSGACAQACEDRLLMMRQTRLMQGKDAERIERVFLITDEAPLSTLLLREFDGTRMIRAGAVGQAFPAPGSSSDHIYLADPRGNLMLRFPKEPDPGRVKKDIERLLRAQGASPG
jgi:hypothetical protein